MTRIHTLVTLATALTALSLAGCSDDSDDKAANNGTTNNGATNNGATNNGATNNGATNNGATNNGATNNGATNNGATNNGTPLECFELSLDPDLPLAVDGVFDATSPTWRRPHDEDEVCPASALLPETAASVPFVAYAFCNTSAQPATITFELLAQDGPNGEAPLDDPYLVLYEGNGIPSDALQCLAANDDIPEALETKDSEITSVVVPAGGAVTVVGTTYTFDPTDGTGTGYYIMVISADP